MILVTSLEYFTWVINIVNFFGSTLSWILTPSIAPWVGVLAALASAITIDTKRWICSLGTFIARSLRIIVIWLIIIHCLRHLPNGKGNRGSGVNGEIKNPKLETVFPAPTTIDGKQVDLVIGFPVDPVNPKRGKAFSCDIRISQESIQSLVAINNIDLLNQLLKALPEKKTGLNEKPKAYLVYTKMTWNPGDSVLTQIEERIKQIQPSTSFVRGD